MSCRAGRGHFVAREAEHTTQNSTLLCGCQTMQHVSDVILQEALDGGIKHPVSLWGESEPDQVAEEEEEALQCFDCQIVYVV